MNDVAVASPKRGQLYRSEEKIYPREVRGRFATLRRIAMFVLLGIFYAGPWLSWNGRQAVLFDLPARKFYVFGLTLWPQDFIFLALLLVIAAIRSEERRVGIECRIVWSRQHYINILNFLVYDVDCFISSRRRHTIFSRDWSSDVCSSDLIFYAGPWLSWNGRQAVLFDLPARKFYVFGLTLWPQDFIFLALLLVIAAI